ncbi:MAG: hypothetical protein N4A46_12365 [Schleiferiaceae bacterium]|jgi:hypothetical protein|nr:hypothetical protein [Schleiferiaceae bacterium]
MGKAIGGVLVGIIVGFIVIEIITFLGFAIFPLEQTDLDPGGVIRVRQEMPIINLMIYLFSSSVGALVAGTLTRRISAARFKNVPALIAGLLLPPIGYRLHLGYPDWVFYTGLLLFIPFAYLGSRLVNKQSGNTESNTID